MCCMDAEDFSSLPLAQYHEDNVLRELNKSAVGFRQRTPTPILSPKDSENRPNSLIRRLSPIGENSLSGASSENDETNRLKCIKVRGKLDNQGE